MIRRSRGNAGKDTIRCPHCGLENLPANGSKAGLIALGCVKCGRWIIVHRKDWEQLGWRGDEAEHDD